VTRRVEVLDLGLGNVLSVINMFDYVGADAVTVVDPQQSDPSALVVLPGVGAFDSGMNTLLDSGWSDTLRSRHTDGLPTLGICLGMQLLCDGSDEGVSQGLGIIPGRFQHLSKRHNSVQVKVPHMGWNEMDFDPELAPWAPRSESKHRFYYVHSFHYTHPTDEHVAGWCDYSGRVVGLVVAGPTVGMQFHPEKSHRFGADLLRRYLEHLDA
jgi:imidazole glycerol-phosphate synthase subunit HisH